MKCIYYYIMLIVSIISMSCSKSDYYNEPIYGENVMSIENSNILIVSYSNGITIVTTDNTRDEWGNCKYSPYTKFFEEWYSKNGWENGLERVYDAWITLDYEYFITTIRCDDLATHQYSLIKYQILDRDTFMKYFNHDKGYGCNKGMIFDIKDIS